MNEWELKNTTVTPRVSSVVNSDKIEAFLAFQGTKVLMRSSSALTLDSLEEDDEEVTAVDDDDF